MKLATLKTGAPDGRLCVVSRDGTRLVPATGICETLQQALEDWEQIAPKLEALSDALNKGDADGAVPVDYAQLAAPLPRAWQWLDGSAFKAHADLTCRAFQIRNPWHERPLMYQGMSHRFLGATEDAVFPTADGNVDFEGEYGVITDAVPMGVTPETARGHIRLLVQINDWSLRVRGREEMATGMGWIHGKPACGVAPFAVTPDELGDAWADARIRLPLHIWRGEELFGRASGAEMSFGFDELVAHAAYSRPLCAGTVIGSGTVANEDYRTVGSSCITEQWGIEVLDSGNPTTPFLSHGERVRMTAIAADGATPFGTLDQRVVIQEA